MVTALDVIITHDLRSTFIIWRGPCGSVSSCGPSSRSPARPTSEMWRKCCGATGDLNIKKGSKPKRQLLFFSKKTNQSNGCFSFLFVKKRNTDFLKWWIGFPKTTPGLEQCVLLLLLKRHTQFTCCRRKTAGCCETTIFAGVLH